MFALNLCLLKKRQNNINRTTTALNSTLLDLFCYLLIPLFFLSNFFVYLVTSHGNRSDDNGSTLISIKRYTNCGEFGGKCCYNVSYPGKLTNEMHVSCLYFFHWV